MSLKMNPQIYLMYISKTLSSVKFTNAKYPTHQISFHTLFALDCLTFIKSEVTDTISGCRYSVPSFLDIGKLYSIMIEDCAEPGNEIEELMKLNVLYAPSDIERRLKGK